MAKWMDRQTDEQADSSIPPFFRVIIMADILADDSHEEKIQNKDQYGILLLPPKTSKIF